MRGAAADMQVTLQIGSGRLSRHIVTGTIGLLAGAAGGARLEYPPARRLRQQTRSNGGDDWLLSGPVRRLSGKYLSDASERH